MPVRPPRTRLTLPTSICSLNLHFHSYTSSALPTYISSPNLPLLHPSAHHKKASSNLPLPSPKRQHHHLQPAPPWHHRSNASSTLQLLPLIRLRHQNLHITAEHARETAPHPPHISSLNLHFLYVFLHFFHTSNQHFLSKPSPSPPLSPPF